MKIIEALKQIKDLERKASDLEQKVRDHSAYLDLETPVYPNQPGQVAKWVQAHGDILGEILRLRVAVQKTNILTGVTIELDGNGVTKTIAEWIHRRRDLAAKECSMWQRLTDRSLKEGRIVDSMQREVAFKIVRCYDPVTRDRNIDLLSSEPSLIDARLEIVNAVTDLIEG